MLQPIAKTFAAVSFLFSCNSTYADLIIDISGTPGSGTTSWQLSGSETAAGNNSFESSGLVASDSWFNLVVLYASTFSGQQTPSNINAGIQVAGGPTRQIDSVFLDSSGPNNDKLGIGILGSTDLSFSIGALVSWSGSFDVAADIGDFNAGSFGSSDYGFDASGALNLQVNVSAVPEPMHFSAFAVFLIGTTCFRRNRLARG